MKKISLVKMKKRQKGRVAEVLGGSVFINRMMSMGVYQGREITKISQFILRGPVAIKVGRSVLALGHGMANRILVELE
ncbi:MAG: FeoA family protein [Candidatus Omnitrophota bacterium]